MCFFLSLSLRGISKVPILLKSLYLAALKTGKTVLLLMTI
ncbi:hypothetical protein AQPE_1190 [Aquipluma nitroreducens]|uniref:Uncharacterized protein n=1 Tax=Aquipluma nitroreducens TaxID=2010828 RepID=A0A5K7S691_9BACT|nr:hypothetical protein AQPE_1190 [Aquipluma nitroreducens]